MTPPPPPADRTQRLCAAGHRWLRDLQPEAEAFAVALLEPRLTQERILQQILHRNRHSAFGRAFRFARIRSAEEYRATVPPQAYDDLRSWMGRVIAGEPGVLTGSKTLRLLPTSGSDAGTKWIPWTRPLAREFLRGIRPWIAALFHQWPALAKGRMYWCITPANPTTGPGGPLPRGFDHDSAYLGAEGQRAFARMAVAPVAREGEDIEHFLDATAAALLAAEDLALISVWNPTWLLGLLARIAHDPDRILRSIPDPNRARWLSARGFRGATSDWWARAWPNLAVVSCWADAASASSAAMLRAEIVHAPMQPKGLLATEGIVSIPFAPKRDPVPALNSHYLEFLDDHGHSRGMHNLEEGGEYSVLLTTGGGLYRYRLGDRIRVTGQTEGVPTLRFIGREGRVVDLVGEKLTEAWVLACLRETPGLQPDLCPFALLSPAAGGAGYVLHLQTCQQLPGELAARLDRLLCRSHHYGWARKAGQLGALRVIRLPDGLDAAGIYRREMRRRGQRDGDIKATVLDRGPDWAKLFGMETSA